MSERKSTRPVHVLIIDDDQDVCDYIGTFLTASGYEVTTMTNPTRAVDELRTQRYHIVVLDLMMPKVDGVEVLKAIRKLDSDVAILILTAYPSVETAVEALKLTVSDYIKKPFDPDEFLQALESICRKKGLLSDPERRLHQTIGKTIREQRKGQSLTLKQLSRRTGLSVSLLSQIERAESYPSVSSLHKVAVALGCRLTEFFGEF